MIRLVFVTTDNRDAHRCYGEAVPRFGPAPEALLQGMAELGGVLEVHVVSCTQRPMESPEKLAENIYFHSLHVPKWGWLRTGYLGCILAVRRKLREIQPDMVHGQGTERECSLCAVFSGSPNVLTIHGNMRGMAFSTRGFFSRIFYGIAAVLEALALAWTDGVFCNSAYTDRMVAPFCRRRWRVPNPLRGTFFQGSSGRKLERSGKPQVLNVGKISPHKRQVELMGAFLQRYPESAPFQIHFVGDVDASHPYGREFAKMLARSPDLLRLGVLSAEALRQQMESSDALVHCSREEAFGLVLAEAMACSLPVFTFSVGGTSDVVEGAEESRSVPEGDWRGLLGAVEAWINNGAPAAQQARALALERFTPKGVALQHEAIYREILKTGT